MSASISNDNGYYIHSVLSNQHIKVQDLTIQSVDNYFADLLSNIKDYILEQQFDIVFDLFEEMITKEYEIRQNHEEPIIFNDMDYNKVLLYQFHSLQCRIIDLLLLEIQDAYLDYLNMVRFSSLFAFQLKNLTLAKFYKFLEKLNDLMYIDEATIERYYDMISQQLLIFQ